MEDEKLYLATLTTHVMYLSPSTHMGEAQSYLKDEIDSNGLFNVADNTQFIEINALEVVPHSWKDCRLWGTEKDITPTEWFNKYCDPEYREYLRLKEKFKGYL